MSVAFTREERRRDGRGGRATRSAYLTASELRDGARTWRRWPTRSQPRMRRRDLSTSRRSIRALVVGTPRTALATKARARPGGPAFGSWITFYNFRRPHQAMNNQTPMAVWRAGVDKIEAAARAVDMPLRLDNANALPTYPQQKQQEAA